MTGTAACGTERKLPHRLPFVLVAAIAVIGLLLRIPSFDGSLFEDELATYFIVTGHSLGSVLDLVRSDQEVTPPLFFILAWLAKGFGDPTQGLKLISLIAGVAAIPLTYLLGLWTVGRRAGLVAAGLVALSPFLIFYSTEARAYELMLLMGLLSTLSLLRALHTGRARWWIGYGASSCAAIYTHYAVVFLLMAQFAWALWARRDAWRPLIAANVGAAIAYIPWLPGLQEDRSAPTNLLNLLHPFSLHTVGSDLQTWAIGTANLPVGSVPGDIARTLAVAGGAVGIAGLFVTLARAEREGSRLSDRAVLVVVLALASPVGAALYSLFGSTVFIPNNLIPSWPGLAVAVAALLTSGPGLMRVAAVALTLAASAIGAAELLDPDNQRPDYEGAATFIDRVGRPGDPVVEVPNSANPLTPLEVALAGSGRWTPSDHHVFRLGSPTFGSQLRARARGLPLLAPLPVPTAKMIAGQAASRARGGDLFVVVPSDSLVRAEVGAVLRRLRRRFHQVATRTFPGFTTVTVDVFRSNRRDHHGGGVAGR
jgi:hypothetical protein